MSRRLYTIHRWISAIAFVQLTAWTVSGAFFAIVPLSRVRGASVPRAHEAPLPRDPSTLPASQALARAAELGLTDVLTLELRATPAGTFYFAQGRDRTLRLDAHTGAPRRVDREEAEETARRDQPDRPAVASATLLENSAGIEYRDRPLPAWRVQMANADGMVVYVDANTGEVTARRNDIWRWYDFLWSLHIMDYRGRESFNHPLIIAAAGFAVLTVLSGVALWLVRLGRWIQRRRRVTVPHP
jgi:uncharacterized iron-regulated membrane protein